MSGLDLSRVPGQPEFNPFEPGSSRWHLMERVKALGAPSEACWKIIDLSESFSSSFKKEGPGAAALAFASRSLILASPEQEAYWRSRAIEPEAIRQAGFLCAREALRDQPLHEAPASHWHLFLSACLDPLAPPSARELGELLWSSLSPDLRQGVALSCAAQMSRLSPAFAPLASRLRPQDQLNAARLCSELCALSPELIPVCRAEIALTRRSTRPNQGWKPAAEWLESRLEGLEIQAVSAAGRSAEEDPNGARRL